MNSHFRLCYRALYPSNKPQSPQLRRTQELVSCNFPLSPPYRSWQTLDLTTPLRSFPSPATHSRAFPHANFSAATLKQDLVHRRPHQADAPSMFGFKPVRRESVRNRVRIKPVSLILDDQPDSFTPFAVTTDFN